METAMKRQARTADFLVIAQRAYNTVETALWAGLAAFAIYFAVFVAPQIPANRTAYEAARLHATAAERDYYCENGASAPAPASMHFANSTCRSIARASSTHPR
jgi:hypothetical protein